MKCPYCRTSTAVTNSRGRSHAVWRRRKCRGSHIFTTYERLDTSQINVRKRDKQSEPLQTTKILLSIAKSGIDHDSAVNLESTVRSKLLDYIAADPDMMPVTTRQIAAITYESLSAFNHRYGDRYRSYCEQLD